MPPAKRPAKSLPARPLSRLEFAQLSPAALKKLKLPAFPEPYKPKYPDLIFVQVKLGLVTDQQYAWNPLGLPEDLNAALLKLFKDGVLLGAEPLMLPGFSLFSTSIPGNPPMPVPPLLEPFVACWSHVGMPRIGTESGNFGSGGVSPTLLKYSKSFRSELILKLTANFQADRDCIICDLKHVPSVKFAEPIRERFSPECFVGGDAMPVPASLMAVPRGAKGDMGQPISPDRIVFGTADYNDPMAAFKYIGWNPEAWKLLYADLPIEVAIVDTGIDTGTDPGTDPSVDPPPPPRFNLFQEAEIPAYYNSGTGYKSNDLDGHGTAVASIIGGKLMGQKAHLPGIKVDLLNSSTAPIPCDFEGLVPNAKLWIFNILPELDANSNKRIDTIAYLRALKTLSLSMVDTKINARLVNISITNSSLAGMNGSDSLTHESLKEASLIEEISNAGRLCIACSGNHMQAVLNLKNKIEYKYPEFVSMNASVGFPARIESVVSVGAVQVDSKRALFSNRSQSIAGGQLSEVSLLAPGKNVLAIMAAKNATLTSYSLDYLTGTSFAAPIVTGCLAKLLSNPNWNWDSVGVDPMTVVLALTQILDKGTRQEIDFKAADAISYIENCGSGILYFPDIYKAWGELTELNQTQLSQSGRGQNPTELPSSA